MLIVLATAIALAHLSGACGASGPATPDFNQTACLPAFENDALCLRGGSWTTTPQGGQSSADLTAPFTSNPDGRKTPQDASLAQAFGAAFAPMAALADYTLTDLSEMIDQNLWITTWARGIAVLAFLAILWPLVLSPLCEAGSEAVTSAVLPNRNGSRIKLLYTRDWVVYLSLRAVFAAWNVVQVARGEAPRLGEGSARSPPARRRRRRTRGAGWPLAARRLRGPRRPE